MLWLCSYKMLSFYQETDDTVPSRSLVCVCEICVHGLHGVGVM